MNGLMTHAGAVKVERGQLDGVATPPPTATWQPIAHKALLDGVQGALERSGLKVVNEQHALGRDGARYFGLLDIEQAGAQHGRGDYRVTVGVRNSHDKSFPGGIACGSRVFVCDNLAFSGEITIARKHTRFINRDLPGLVESAVGRLGDLRRHQDQRIATYKRFEILDAQAHDLIIQAIDARVVPVTRIPEVVKEWRTPRHPEFVEGGKTAWRLFNAFTQTLKDSALFNVPKATQALHGLLDTACSLN
jgi:hypothetical protein